MWREEATVCQVFENTAHLAAPLLCPASSGIPQRPSGSRGFVRKGETQVNSGLPRSLAKNRAAVPAGKAGPRRSPPAGSPGPCPAAGTDPPAGPAAAAFATAPPAGRAAGGPGREQGRGARQPSPAPRRRRWGRCRGRPSAWGAAAGRGSWAGPRRGPRPREVPAGAKRGSWGTRGTVVGVLGINPPPRPRHSGELRQGGAGGVVVLRIPGELT